MIKYILTVDSWPVSEFDVSREPTNCQKQEIIREFGKQHGVGLDGIRLQAA